MILKQNINKKRRDRKKKIKKTKSRGENQEKIQKMIGRIKINSANRKLFEKVKEKIQYKWEEKNLGQ